MVYWWKGFFSINIIIILRVYLGWLSLIRRSEKTVSITKKTGRYKYFLPHMQAVKSLSYDKTSCNILKGPQQLNTFALSINTVYTELPKQWVLSLEDIFQSQHSTAGLLNGGKKVNTVLFVGCTTLSAPNLQNKLQTTAKHLRSDVRRSAKTCLVLLRPEYVHIMHLDL